LISRTLELVLSFIQGYFATPSEYIDPLFYVFKCFGVKHIVPNCFQAFKVQMLWFILNTTISIMWTNLLVRYIHNKNYIH